MKKQPTLFLLLFLGTVFWGCTKNLPKNYEVYRNDFEKGRGDLKVYNFNSLDTAQLNLLFNQTHVLGPLNHKAVYREFLKLPKHSLLKITFDLYLHDQWTGNKLQSNPDLWAIFLDREKVFATTFSNLDSFAQAYPDIEGHYYPAFSNAYRKNLPGLCSLVNSKTGSSVYQITWIKAHTNSSLELALSDLVVENDLCIKSWSIDNLVVTCIAYDN